MNSCKTVGTSIKVDYSTLEKAVKENVDETHKGGHYKGVMFVFEDHVGIDMIKEWFPSYDVTSVGDNKIKIMW